VAEFAGVAVELVEQVVDLQQGVALEATRVLRVTRQCGPFVVLPFVSAAETVGEQARDPARSDDADDQSDDAG